LALSVCQLLKTLHSSGHLFASTLSRPHAHPTPRQVHAIATPVVFRGMEAEEEEARELPDEVLQTVFSHLQPSDLLRCAATSRAWRRASEHHHVWRTLYHEVWGSDASGDGWWKLVDGVADGWKTVALDREWRERQMVRILDDLVWPTKRAESREKLRALFGPIPGPGAESLLLNDRRHRFRAATFALDNEVCWNGEKVLSRSCRALDAKMHLTEFEVCDALRDQFAGGASSPGEYRCVQFCESAAGLIARLLDNDLDVSTISGALDRLGAEFRRRVDASCAYDGVITMANTPAPGIDILGRFLFGNAESGGEDDLLDPSFAIPQSGGLGFTGNRGDYYSRWNSSLAMVLTHRKGIPITMTILYAAVARRAGLAVQFLNNPGHFMCMVRPTGDAAARVVYAIDVFNADVTELQVSAMDPRLLQPPEERDVCFRVLNNLQIICSKPENDGQLDGAGRASNSPFHVMQKKPLRFAVLSAMIALKPTFFGHHHRKERLELALDYGYHVDILDDLRGGVMRQGANESHEEYAKRTSEFIESRVNCLTNPKTISVGLGDEIDTLGGWSEHNPRGVYPVGTIIRHTQRDVSVLSVVSSRSRTRKRVEVCVSTPSLNSGQKDRALSLLYVVDDLENVRASRTPGGEVRRGMQDIANAQVVKLDKLPEDIARSRVHMCWLGSRFESFDAQRGVLVPDAYHTWLNGGRDDPMDAVADDQRM